jgi:hypothetical protein
MFRNISSLNIENFLTELAGGDFFIDRREKERLFAGASNNWLKRIEEKSG